MKINKVAISTRKPIEIEVICGAKIVEKYPELMWVNIGVRRLTEASQKGSLVLVGFVKGNKTYSYIAEAENLENSFKEHQLKINRNGNKYDFYVDYRKGIIYNKREEDKKEIYRLRKKLNIDNKNQ